MTPVVRLEQVSKAYGLGRRRFNPRLAVPGPIGERLKGPLHQALDDVSFDVGPGRSLGLIGRNGAGKSTVLKLVAGVVTPSQGRVEVRGRIAALIELGAGFHPEMTGIENVEFSAAVLGMGRRRLRELVPEIVAFADIGDYLGTPVKRYSSGMLARLGFAVASHLDAEILVIDEVLSVGDSAFQRKCYDRISARRAEGAAVLYVTHAMWTLPLVCDEALLLAGGRVALRGEPQSVVQAYLQGSEAGAVVDQGVQTFIRDFRLSRDSLQTGDQLSVSLTLELPHPSPRSVLAIVIATPSGTGVAGLTTAMTPVDFSRPGRHTVTCEIAGLPLVPASYEVCAVFHLDSTAPVVDDFRKLALTIGGEVRDPTHGPVALDGAWRCEVNQLG